MTTGERELLPCPFCGGEPYLTNVRMSDHTFYIGCYNELCWRPRTDGHGDRASVIKAWNTRWQAGAAQAAAQPDELSRLRKIEHLVWHLLDDNCEENATTGVTTLGQTDDTIDVWLEKLLPLFEEHPEPAAAPQGLPTAPSPVAQESTSLLREPVTPPVPDARDWVRRLGAQYGARQAASLRGDQQAVDAANLWIGIIAQDSIFEILAAAQPVEPVAGPPREPTDAMLNAIPERWWDDNSPGDIWRAMWDAASVDVALPVQPFRVVKAANIPPGEIRFVDPETGKVLGLIVDAALPLDGE